VCRCTGYAKIIDAVGAASRGEVSGAEDPAAPDRLSPADEPVKVKGSPA
jgi:xanthine dehydrogenase iron-sulfur cluster and FAD-binding subunit A